MVYLQTLLCLSRPYSYGETRQLGVQTVCAAHLPEKHPVEVGREVDVVPQRKTADVAPQVRIGLVRNLHHHHHHHHQCDPEENRNNNS